MNLHKENCYYNKIRTKGHMKNNLTQPKSKRWMHSSYKGGLICIQNINNAENVLESLSKKSVYKSQRTLQDYAKLGLIPKAVTKGAGQGYGKVSEYPPETSDEFYASWYLRQLARVPVDKIREARRLVKEFENECAEDETIKKWSEILSSVDKLDCSKSEEGEYSDEVRFALKESLTDKTNKKDIITLGLVWFYLSRQQESSVKEIVKQYIKDNKKML